MPHPLHSDEDILRELLSGDRQRGEAVSRYLHQQYRGLVANLVQTGGGNINEDVDDVLDTAATALVLHVRNGTYQPGKAGLSTYFYGIARNTLRNRMRERNARKELLMGELPAELPALTLNDVEKRLNSKEVGEKVAAAIRQLDDTCQQVLMQYWLEGKSMREIAEALEKSEDAVKQRNHRCMKQLREILKYDFENWFNEK